MNYTKFSLAILSIIGLCLYIHQNYVWQKSTSTSQIIYLNGASSSGKSTLARALQNKLSKPFLLIGIDQIIYMMPEKLNDWHHETHVPGFSWQPVKDAQGNIIGSTLEIGSYGQHMIETLKKIVISLAKLHHNIIIDDVSFGKEQVDSWKQALKEFNVLWVGITAPIEILEQREQARGDRKIGQARWQAEHVHQNVNYDIMLDTHQDSIENNINIILEHIRS